MPGETLETWLTALREGSPGMSKDFGPDRSTVLRWTFRASEMSQKCP